uniref:Uncharacterized protein n=1 Tax=Cynoglossus semilaevis TaxID=244447 RepID=A0A3P8V5K1_CYNSE
MSIIVTLILISEVPVLGGFPPSIAVSVSSITSCFSLSRAFCNTNSADTLYQLPSGLVVITGAL